MLALYLSTLETDSDKETFTALYEHYETAMYNIAFGILHDRYLAEDAVHDSFLKLTKYISNIRDITCHKTRALIVIIVKNTAIDLYRKRTLQNEIPDNPLLEEMVATEELPLDKIIADERFDALKHKLQSLNSEYLDIITLRYLHGYSGEEIAHILGITPGTARQRLSRARRAVMKLMEEDEILGEDTEVCHP